MDTAQPLPATSPTRVRSVDILRGLVMVIMALDHCRDFFSPTPFLPENLSATTPIWFATRWVTHFCAPVFVFLAGTSAWLFREHRGVSKRQLAWFLVSRGLWLIVVEIVVIGSLVHFGGYPFFFLQVIWVIGLSMLILAAMLWLPFAVTMSVGIVLISAHNLLDGYANPFGSEFAWQLLHVQGLSNTQPIPTIVAYPLIPWPGVMMLGYCFGRVFSLPPEKRDRSCLIIGSAATAMFVFLRLVNVYGDPQPWQQSSDPVWLTALSFVNTTKYPPSFQFLLMTIGPALMLLPALERLPTWLARLFSVYGRVPFFYYILHWLLIRAASWIWIKLRFDSTQNLIFSSATDWPPEYAPSVPRTYIAWLLVVLLTFPLCSWYANLKARHRDWWWLSYL